jgi:hypothetical protein
VKVKLGYDDSLDVFGIHGIGGIVGAKDRRRGPASRAASLRSRPGVFAVRRIAWLMPH